MVHVADGGFGECDNGNNLGPDDGGPGVGNLRMGVAVDDVIDIFRIS